MSEPDADLPKPNVIRQAVIDDAAGLHQLRLEALRSHPEAFGSDAERESGEGMSRWEERLAAGAKGAVFIGVAGQDLIGMAGIFPGDRVKLRHNATIYGVYVRPPWRGRGVAGKLIESCLAWARQRGLKLVKLAVVTTNPDAVRCYHRAGFRIYGIDPQVIQWEGVFYDELLMVREVSASVQPSA